METVKVTLENEYGKYVVEQKVANGDCDMLELTRIFIQVSLAAGYTKETVSEYLGEWFE